MRNKKILSLVVVLAGAVCSAYLLFSNQNVGAKSLAITGSERTDSQFFDKKNDQLTTNISDPSYNLTDEAAKEYTRKIIQMNTGGQGTGAPVVLPTALDFETIVKGYISQNIQFKEYTEKDIRISQDNSAESKTSYLTKLQTAQKKLESSLKTGFVYAAALFISEQKSDEIQKHINASQEYITNILEITVPTSAKQFHIDLLNIHEKRKLLGTMLLENPDDPLKSVVILQEIEKLTEKEMSLVDSFASILRQ